MKKLVSALAATVAFAIATPAVFACPGMDHEKAQDKTADTKTADKAPAKKADEKPATAPVKAKDTVKKPTATAKPA